jgi:transposase-like protein
MRISEEDRSTIAAQVLDSVRRGDSLRAACREAGIGASTFLDWVGDDKELAEQYTRARETGADAEFERFLEMSEVEPERTERGVDSGWVQWQRTRMDAVKWALSKKAPRKYGERLDLKHSGSVGLQINIDVGEADND